MTLKPTKLTLAASVLPLIAALALLGGCKNFMSNDTDFKANIQKAVDVANAAQVTVNVAPSDGTQVQTTPYPSLTAKVGVPFTITATASANYGFIRWAAYGSDTSTVELSGIVSFGNATSAITTATLLADTSNVYIRPVVERRPYVTSALPENDCVTNAPICLYFNKPIAESSFYATAADKTSGNYKNVTISMTVAGSVIFLTSSYGKLSLSSDGKRITIPNTTALTTGRKISVLLSSSIVDTSGLKMTDDYSYAFKVGTGTDNSAPTVGVITGGLTSGYEFGTDQYTRRVGAISDSVPLYLQVKGSDDNSVDSVSVYDYWSANANGENQNDTLGGQLVSSPWIADTGTQVQVPKFTSSLGDGLIKLKIVLTDANGNATDAGTTDTSGYYNIVKDTTPPPVDSAQIARVTIAAAGSGTAGFYNATAEVPFVPSTTSPLVDYGAASYRSSVVYYRFGFAESSFTNSLAWIPATTTAKIAVSGYTGNDSLSVPVYFQMKDDLGNTSAITQLGTIAIDKTKPTGGIVATSVTTINSKQMIGSTSVPVTVSGSDTTSGIKSFYVAGGDGEVLPTAPTLSDSWIDYSSIQTATATVSSTNGAKHVWVWFRDKADNISEAIKDSQSLVLDNADPVVNKFYLSKATAFAANSTPAAQDKQYTNDSTLYFAFTATESTGIGSFAYSSDGGSTWSKYFSAITTATQTDADHAGYGVSLCNSVEISTGLWLVTGKLTVPATDGNKTMQIKVRDLVRTASEVTAYTTDANITKVMFDATKPALTGDSLTSAHVYNGTYTYVGAADVTLSYTTSDAGSGLDTHSITGDLATGVSTVSLGSSAAEKKAEGLATVNKTENITLASGDGAKNVTLAVTDWAGNSVYKTFQAYLDTTAPKFTTILNQAYGAAQTYSNATDGGVSLYGPTQTSNSWASFYTYMTTHIESGSGIDTANQQLRLYRVSPAQIASAVSGGTLTANATGYSGSAVGGDLLTGYTALENLTSTTTAPLTTSANPVIVSYNYGKTITLPSDLTLGHPLSGYYVAGFKALDKLGNTSAEQKTGYFYDQTAPMYNDIKVFDKNNSEISTVKIGNYNYVKAPADNLAFVRFYITDRPSTDPSGSGLSRFVPSIYRSTEGNYTTEQTIAESSATAPEDRYFLINSASGSSWNLDSNVFLRFAGIVYDQSGNGTNLYTARSSNYYFLAMDNASPTSANSLPTLYDGAVSGIKYVNGTVSSFTPTDPSTPHMASGVKAWALTTGADSALAATGLPDYGTSWTTSGSWNAYSSGSVTTTTTLYNLISSGVQDVYLHLVDNVGNVSHALLGKICLDATPPVITGNPEMATDSGFTKLAFTDGSNNWYTNKTSVFIRTKANDRVSDTDGSGVKTIKTYGSVFAGSRDKVITTPALTEDANTYYLMANNDAGKPDGDWDGYTTMSSAWTFRSEIVDAVGNSTSTVNCNLYYDNTVPEVSGTSTVNNTNYTGSVYYSGPSTTISFVAADKTGNAGASGVAAWGLSTSAIAPLATATGSAAGWTGWKTIASPVAGTDGRSITTSAGDVSGLISGSSSIYVYIMDNVGNISAGSLIGIFNIDSTAPASGDTHVTKLNGSTGASASVNFVKTSDASITFDSADNAGGSGIARYFISTSSSETDADVAAGTTTAHSLSAAFTDGSTTNVDVSSLLSTSSGTDLYLYISDKVGNVLKYGKVTGSLPVQLDSTVPVFTTPSDGLNDVIINPTVKRTLVSSAGPSKVSSLTNQNVKFFMGTTETSNASGLTKITLSDTGLSSTQTNTWVVKEVKEGSWGTTLFSGSPTKNGSDFYVTLTTPYTGSAPLYISGVDLSGTGTMVVSVKLTDAAGNDSALGSSQTVTRDSQSPVINASVLADTTSVSSGWCNDVEPVLTLTAWDTDTGISGGAIASASGIKSFEFSGTGLTMLSTVSVSINGGSAIDSAHGLVLGTDDDSSAMVITLPDADVVKDGSNTIAITGLHLPSVDGQKTVTVKMYDAAGNSATASPTINLDTVNTVAPTVALGSSNGTTVYPTSLAAAEYLKGTAGSADSFYVTLSGGEAASGYTASGVADYYSSTVASPTDAELTKITSTTNWNLSPVDASTTYYFWTKDKTGTRSPASAPLTVIKDNTGPAIDGSATFGSVDASKSIVDGTLGGNATRCTAGAKVTFKINDAGAGSSAYVVSKLLLAAIQSGTGWDTSNTLNAAGTATWETLAAGTGTATSTKTVNFSALLSATARTTVYLYTKDAVGNINQIVLEDGSSSTWTLDSAAPTTGTISIGKDANTTIVSSGVAPHTKKFISSGTMSLTPSDALTDIASYKIVVGEDTSTPAWQTYSGSVFASPVAFPASSDQRIQIGLKDAVGNESYTAVDATTTYWTTDSLGPVPVLSVSKSKEIVGASTPYYTNGVQVSLRMTDAGSGSASFIISNLPSISAVRAVSSFPDAGCLPSAGWQSLADYNAGDSATVTGNIDFTSLLTEGTEKSVYVYTKDAQGNIGQYEITKGTAGDKWIKDTTGPTLTSVEYTGTAYGTGPTYVKSSATVKVTVEADAAGLAGWSLYTAGTPDSSNVATWPASWTNTASGAQEIAFPSLTSEKPLWICAADALGNTSKVELSAGATWLTDGGAPSVASMLASGTGLYFKGNSASIGTLFYASTPTDTTLTVSTPASDPIIAAGVSGSGVKGYSLTQGSYTSTMPVKAGTASYTMYVSDQVGNEASVSVNPQQDNTPPRFTLPWSSSTTISQAALVSDDGGSDIKTFDKGTLVVTTFADVSTSGQYTLAATDNVGNASTADIYVYNNGGAVTIPLYLIGKSKWTATGGTNVSIPTVSCVAYQLTGPTPVAKQTGIPSSLNGLSNGDYVLTLYDDASSESHPLSYSFKISSGAVQSIRVTGNPVIDDRISSSLVAGILVKKSIESKLLIGDTEGSKLISWSAPEMKADSLSLVGSESIAKSVQSGSTATGESNKLTLAALHSLQIARAKARIGFVASQNTDAAQNAADKNISPETANNGKQDDSGRMNGVGYNQELVRIAKSAMAPLAEQYLAQHGVSLDGTQASAEGRMSGTQTASVQSGLTDGPGIGMMIPAKDFQVFRREPGFGLVS